MANDDRNRRRGGLKRNLALPGENNRQNVLGGRGQIQDQTSPIVSEKALEQPLVKPGGVLKGRSTVRREAPVATPGATTTELFKLGPRGPQDIAGAGARPGKATEAVGPQGLSAEDRTLLENLKRRGVTSEPIIREGKVVGLRGKPVKPEAEVQKPKKFTTFSIGGIENILSRTGELAERFSRPEAVAKQRRARGVAAGRKGRRAEVKSVNEQIKAVTSALKDTESLFDEEGETEISDFKTNLRSQLNNLIKQQSDIAAGVGGGPDTSTVSGFATQLKELGASNEEIQAMAQRRFGGEGT